MRLLSILLSAVPNVALKHEGVHRERQAGCTETRALCLHALTLLPLSVCYTPACQISFQPSPFLHQMLLLESQEIPAQCFLVPKGLADPRKSRSHPWCLSPHVPMLQLHSNSPRVTNKGRIPNHSCWTNLGVKPDISVKQSELQSCTHT